MFLIFQIVSKILFIWLYVVFLMRRLFYTCTLVYFFLNCLYIKLILFNMASLVH